ncbi:hypothetical protein [uncultured Methanobrevibacter sp.]|nr:hypothetical protein [uncultured Methanobrevibacter sp.]
MGSKVAGIVFIIGSLYYIVSEAISATFFNASLFNTYFFTLFLNLEFQM